MAITLRKGKYPYEVSTNVSLEKVQTEIKTFEFDFSEKKDRIYASFLEHILHEPKRKVIEKHVKKLDFYLDHKFIK